MLESIKPVYFHLHGVAPILGESQFSFFARIRPVKNFSNLIFRSSGPLFMSTHNDQMLVKQRYFGRQVFDMMLGRLNMIPSFFIIILLLS